MRDALLADQQVHAQVITLNTNGRVRFKTDCGPAVGSPIVAPDGAGNCLCRAHDRSKFSAQRLAYFAPAPFATAIRFTVYTVRFCSFLRPQTGETVMRQIVRAQQRKMAARLRPAKTAIAHESLLAGKASAIWRQAPHVAPDHQQAARLRPAKASALTVSTASFHFTLLHKTGRPHC